MEVPHFFLNLAAREVGHHSGLFNLDEYEDVRGFFLTRPETISTPLISLPALASRVGVRDILVKDESTRFGLNSFKITGVIYAVDRLIRQGRLIKGSVLACATEGNHGRAVARIARDYGLGAKIYVSDGTSTSRVAALREEGAEVLIVEGSYDDAVQCATGDSVKYGWTIFSDTSWPGYDEIPRLIMAGYTRLLDEAEGQWGEKPPDVVFVQAGVGGLACSIASWLCNRYAQQRPFTVICEPTRAACLFESAKAGRTVSLRGPFHTIMAGLRCGEPSHVAQQTILSIADAFVTVNDVMCLQAMQALNGPLADDPKIDTGPSGACGLAALLTVLEDDKYSPVRITAGLNEDSRVLVINTEGPTDLELCAEGVCTAKL